MATIDLFMAYSFIKKLVTPFERWNAFKLGIIDKDGNVLRKRSELNTVQERNAFGFHDILVMNLKRLLEKVPGGKSTIASYTAAMLLLKEEVESDEDRSMEEILADLEARYTEYLRRVEDMMEEAPVNVVGTGNIAGVGVGPKGEPGVTPAQAKRYKKKNEPDAKEVLAKVRRVLGKAP